MARKYKYTARLWNHNDHHTSVAVHHYDAGTLVDPGSSPGGSILL